MEYVRKAILNAADASIDQASAAIDGSQLFCASVQIEYATSGSGGISLQASNDPANIPSNGASPVPANWNDIPNTSIIMAGSGTFLIPKTDICYRWLRVYFSSNGGEGTISANITAQGV